MFKDDLKEHRGEHDGLPLYEVVDGKITAIALVKEPAIEVGAVFNNDGTFLGPVMIPDQRIFRDSGLQDTEDCYWYFSADTIGMLQRTFTGKMKLGH